MLSMLLIFANIKRPLGLLYKSIGGKSINNFYLLSFIFFLLTGCSCACEYTVPELDLNYSTAQSNVTVFADGCGELDGSVDANGMTSLTCGTPNTTNYQNRGRWVK